MASTCEHAESCTAEVKVIKAHLMKSNRWRNRQSEPLTCHSCSSSRDLWLCLRCCAVNCGRTRKKHALAHFEEDEKHCVCLNVASGMLWCYACDCELLDEPPESGVLDGVAIAENAAAFRTIISREPGTPTGPVIKRARSTRSPPADVMPTPVCEDNVTEDGGACGLSNLGNTCFMNAMIQAMSNVPALARVACEVPTASFQAHGSLGEGFASVLTELWSGRYAFVSPSVVLRRLRKCNPMFEGFSQHDSQEALRFLLSDMHDSYSVNVPLADVPHYIQQTFEEIPPSSASAPSSAPASTPSHSPKRTPRPSTVSPRSSEVESTSIEAAGDLSARRDDTTPMSPPALPAVDSRGWLNDGPYTGPPTEAQSIVSDVFRGTLASRVTCRGCNTISVKYDHFYDLSLSIPRRRSAHATETESSKSSKSWLSSICSIFGGGGGVRLIDCLYQFCESESLTGRDRYHCDHCKSHQDADKSIAIARLPEVLVIHLKRFNYNSMWGSKISTSVDFPTEGLDMSPFVWQSPAVLASAASAASAVAAAAVGSSLDAGSAAGAGAGAGAAAAADDGAGSTQKGIAEEATNPMASASPGVVSSPKEAPATVAAIARSSSSSHRRASQQTTYDLVSVVEHMGGMGGGHYVAYGKNRVSNQWFCFDDRSVSEASGASVARREGYVLVYQRRHPIMPLPALPVKPSEPVYCYVSLYWWVKRMTCGVPGPVSAAVLMCDHGRVKNELLSEIRPRVVPLTRPLYEWLCRHYGAAPVLMALDGCHRCVDEQAALARRRQTEQARIHEQDTTQVPGSECWYLISEAWLDKWRRFIDNRGSSDGTGRGALPPGPISNHTLLRRNGDPLPNLRKIVHYRGVNVNVWSFLQGIYRGGPEIKRKVLDLYDGVRTATDSDEEGDAVADDSDGDDDGAESKRE